MLTNILLIIVIAFFVLWLFGLILSWAIGKIAPEGEEIPGRGFVRKE